MKITINTMKKLSEVSNAIYDDIKLQFLFHSNKLEGSTFNIEQLNVLLDENKVIGEHSIDDVQETINSIELFDFVVNTLGETLSERLLREYHQILKRNTKDEKNGYAGVFKVIPNRLRGVDLKVAEPYEVPEKIAELIKHPINSLEDVADFHQRFEAIHPFQDGNGRIGRYLILKQCIESGIDLVAIDDEYNREYKQALYQAQVENNLKPLVEIFKQCQLRLNDKLAKYEKYIADLNGKDDDFDIDITDDD